RDFHVTGVQTCALPISDAGEDPSFRSRWFAGSGPGDRPGLVSLRNSLPWLGMAAAGGLWSLPSDHAGRRSPHLNTVRDSATGYEIGRASCREGGPVPMR